MAEVYLLLGSNKGRREQYISKAMQLIETHCGNISKESSMYETEAWGLKEQAAFLNKAICITTSLSPVQLLQAIKAIEEETGRTPAAKWGPREIDIDILFYNDEVISLPELQIPHPHLHERKFTLAPLCEIAPDIVHPTLKKNIKKLLAECIDNSIVKLLTPTDKNG
ncbi:MAG: 2-amino-4-hydroxy-6-hydroxymethyldihydropteridine diphosphokinase [Chitinophagales bacterium]|nr:2-amino-4-hydroxy-6-hydroxymethyldihydropteridine diphosphokinase [Chitinophagales bacterium]